MFVWVQSNQKKYAMQKQQMQLNKSLVGNWWLLYTQHMCRNIIIIILIIYIRNSRLLLFIYFFPEGTKQAPSNRNDRTSKRTNETNGLGHKIEVQRDRNACTLGTPSKSAKTREKNNFIYCKIYIERVLAETRTTTSKGNRLMFIWHGQNMLKT